MLNDILTGYGIFILEIVTLLIVLAVIFAVIVTLKNKKNTQNGELQIIDLAKVHKENQKKLKQFRLDDEALKILEKAEKKKEKNKTKEKKQQYKNKHSLSEIIKQKPCVYVLDFKGDIHASAVQSLQEEINTILAVANPCIDEVLLRLESPGGIVPGYGFAASQLKRLRNKGIALTIAVDKVAASGGYMMACVANKIVAAPFAILGSIGVVAQVPNLHRFLKRYDVDVDVMTAGEYKRTVTLLGGGR